mmetsp:Transcript_18818/g.52746  ORF Transcript_18818/g.52746 Transcript_18818/m.52746 type:complete len:201 (-) Transcript_18818:7-609(-)
MEHPCQGPKRPSPQGPPAPPTWRPPPLLLPLPPLSPLMFPMKRPPGTFALLNPQSRSLLLKPLLWLLPRKPPPTGMPMPMLCTARMPWDAGLPSRSTPTMPEASWLCPSNARTASVSCAMASAVRAAHCCGHRVTYSSGGRELAPESGRDGGGWGCNNASFSRRGASISSAVLSNLTLFLAFCCSTGSFLCSLFSSKPGR